jgi:hypothetical protein
LRLEKPVALNKNVQIACLPNLTNLIYPREKFKSYAVGWGLLDETLWPSYQLQNVDLLIYNESLCENSTIGSLTNWRAQICAGILLPILFDC